ncbi:MAG: hypothetical protein JSU93_03720 [Methanobacteriota archaeon]|nr:MAG: hypothetical protein JSU93_03720 [Euryarchaeota archaeon]
MNGSEKDYMAETLEIARSGIPQATPLLLKAAMEAEGCQGSALSIMYLDEVMFWRGKAISSLRYQVHGVYHGFS